MYTYNYGVMFTCTINSGFIAENISTIVCASENPINKEDVNKCFYEYMRENSHENHTSKDIIYNAAEYISENLGYQTVVVRNDSLNFVIGSKQ